MREYKITRNPITIMPSDGIVKDPRPFYYGINNKKRNNTKKRK